MPRTLAFGDIHGCLKQLDALLGTLALTLDDHIIFLGDYIDRGPDSAGVINRLIHLKKTRHVTTIKGNHEEMLLASRDFPDAYTEWLFNGGSATLDSYPGGALRNIPPRHWRFLEKELVDYLETDTHIFVHAGVQNDLPLSEQPDYILRWLRFEDLAPHQSGKIIICGHTPQRSGRPLNRTYGICLDTNACRGGFLTCLDVVSGTLWQADADAHVVRTHLCEFEHEH